MSSKTPSNDYIIPYSDDGFVPHSISITYYVLCGLGFLITVISFIVQFSKPANYGKFDSDDSKKEKEKEKEENLVTSSSSSNGSGCRIPQKIAHFCSDFPPGVILFTIIFFTATRRGEPRSDPSYVMLACWLLHYVWRGFITPLLMRYSSPDVDIGIMLGGLFPNMIFNVVVALHISVIDYGDDYFKDPRFGIGLAIFVIGYVCNRWADLHLRSLREEAEADNKGGGENKEEKTKKKKYVLPKGGLFKLCYCPNYFFEFVEWVGFAILSSSLAGTIWALFGLSTFLPRSLVTKAWYLRTFEGEVDEKKAALFPFLI